MKSSATSPVVFDGEQLLVDCVLCGDVSQVRCEETAYE